LRNRSVAIPMLPSSMRLLAGIVAAALLTGCAASPPTTHEAEAGTSTTRNTVSCFPRAETWFERHQDSDGSWANDHGEPDFEATCLCALALLGDGSTMRSGPYKLPIKRAIRWLRNRQQADGTFASSDDHRIRQHALATYVMVEAAGLSNYRLLWQNVMPALRTLIACRDPDGGWRAAREQTQCDARTTGWAILALLSAREFQDTAPDELPWPTNLPTNAQLVTWFDQHPADNTEAAAIELLCRQFAGQTIANRPALLQTANRLMADTQTHNPLQVFWTSYALTRIGGMHWQQWQQQLKALSERKAADLEDLGNYGSWPASGELSRAATTALY
jgi:hypothetical protein